MNKIKKNKLLILAIAAVIAGIICLIFSKASASMYFLSCIFFGITFIYLAKHTKVMYYRNLIKLDKTMDNYLKDVQINGENSEYYGFNEDKKNEILTRFIKKSKNNYKYFNVSAVVIIIVGIFMLI